MITISLYLLNKYIDEKDKAEKAKEIVNNNARVIDGVLKDENVINYDSELIIDIDSNSNINYKMLSKSVLDKLNKENATDKIIAYLDTGEKGIREIVAHDPDSDFYDRKDIHGNYDHGGTVFLYKFNNSPLDPYTTYFGHNMLNGTRFSKINDYEKNKDYLQIAYLFTYEGIIKYKLVSVAKVNDRWYNEKPTWNKQGVKEYFEEVSKNAEIMENKEGYLEEDQYMFLSTCFGNYGESKVVAVYRLIEHLK